MVCSLPPRAPSVFCMLHVTEPIPMCWDGFFTLLRPPPDARPKTLIPVCRSIPVVLHWGWHCPISGDNCGCSNCCRDSYWYPVGGDTRAEVQHSTMPKTAPAPRTIQPHMSITPKLKNPLCPLMGISLVFLQPVFMFYTSLTFFLVLCCLQGTFTPLVGTQACLYFSSIQRLFTWFWASL